MPVPASWRAAMRHIVLAIALAAAFPLAASAQNQPAQNPPPTAQPPSTGEFADQAAVINRFEIQAGQVAQQKTDNSEVKDYAQMIVQDHQKALAQLQPIIEGLDIKVLASLDQVHLSMLHHLKMLSGKQFLSTFKLQQVEGHKQAILLMEAYAHSGDNSKLQKWAQDTLPVLQKHLAHARQLPPSPETG